MFLECKLLEEYIGYENALVVGWPSVQYRTKTYLLNNYLLIW